MPSPMLDACVVDWKSLKSLALRWREAPNGVGLSWDESFRFGVGSSASHAGLYANCDALLDVVP